MVLEVHIYWRYVIAKFMFESRVLGVILNGEITIVLEAIIDKDLVAREDFSYVDVHLVFGLVAITNT